MTKHSRKLAVLAIIAAGLTAATAQAQSYNAAYRQPAPLDSYAMQRGQPKQMIPKNHMNQPHSHMMQPQSHMRNFRFANRTGISMRMVHGPRFDRMHRRLGRRFVEEFRGHGRRHGSYVDNTEVGDTEYVRGNTEYVREAPVVVEQERYVDDPPRVIERQYTVEDQPVHTGCNRGLFTRCGGHRAIGEYGGEYGGQRVIDADARITVIGPDRMSIQLYRKGYGATMTGQ